MPIAATLTVNPEEIPEGGIDLEGRLVGNLFAVDDDLIRPMSPVDYRLHLDVNGGELMVSGELDGEFELLCVRTRKYFPFSLKMQDFRAQIAIENGACLDLTDQIREDILLALPDYPRIDGEEAVEDSSPADSGTEDTRNIWKALDQITSTKK